MSFFPLFYVNSVFCMCVVCLLSFVDFNQIFYPKKPYTIRGGGGAFKASLRHFALTHLILELHYCALVTFPQKIVLNRLAKKLLIRGQGLAVKGGLKI